MTHGGEQTTQRHAFRNEPISAPLHISLSLQPSLLVLPHPHLTPHPPFLIFLRMEVRVCLAHDIDFHQRLEITPEPLPGQLASTFSHFCILALRFSPPSVLFHCFGRSSQSNGRTNGVIGGGGDKVQDGGWRRRVQQLEGWWVRRKQWTCSERWMAMPGKKRQDCGNSGVKCECVCVVGGWLMISAH